MSLADDYQANYEQIARDHIAHWRETGQNPWQPPEHVEVVLPATVALIRQYTVDGATILDAGCGMGDLALRLPERRWFGIDLSPDYIEIARSRGVTAAVGDLTALPFGPSFEAVVATDVLEHVLDLNAVLTEMVRVLLHGGVLILRMPEAEDLTPYLAPDYPYRYVHLRRFDEPSLRLLLNRVFDLDVLEARSVFGTCAELLVVARKR